jgi:dimethylaniline monooxygenase (N-oxide forming)
MERYADHFNLGPHCKLNTAVERVSREDDGRWRLDFKDEPPLWFDKVVMATGPHVRAVMPTFQGAHLFTGRILHVKAFKRFVCHPLLQTVC